MHLVSPIEGSSVRLGYFCSFAHLDTLFSSVYNATNGFGLCLVLTLYFVSDLKLWV